MDRDRPLGEEGTRDLDGALSGDEDRAARQRYGRVLVVRAGNGQELVLT
jgi:hypothetical protein